MIIVTESFQSFAWESRSFSQPLRSTNRQCFRAARRKDREPYVEVVTRMTDLFHKWTADCTTIEAISEKLLIEQLLEYMPTALRIWLSEKKKTCSEAGKLADECVLATKIQASAPYTHQNLQPTTEQLFMWPISPLCQQLPEESTTE